MPKGEITIELSKDKRLNIITKIGMCQGAFEALKSYIDLSNLATKEGVINIIDQRIADLQDISEYIREGKQLCKKSK